MTTRQGNALLIPSRAFRNIDDRIRFIADAQRWRQRAVSLTIGSSRDGNLSNSRIGEEAMENLSARTVFFVRDAPRAMEFYTNSLGFLLDWTYEEKGRPYVVQVSLFGLQIILNQAESPEEVRPGHGRLFVGLDEAQTLAVLHHIKTKGISATYTHWGAPTMAIFDLDRNELFFWLSEAERAKWQQAHAGAN
jgi:catechol 2,3-dioxygenase-like lactoylglutathione lyase family enzyme